MNKLLKELELQAYIERESEWIDPSSNMPVMVKGREFSREKFAELIVQQAAAFVSGAAEVYNQAEQDACVRASKGLKKYFGVEE